MSLLCHIRYEIDPFKQQQFADYAKNWATVIPRCGGVCLGYFLPHEGTNNIAVGLNVFDSLAHYETYRNRLRQDSQGAENYRLAETERLILGEQRSFLRAAQGHAGGTY